MQDDFNTAGAVSVLFDMVTYSNQFTESNKPDEIENFSRLFFFLAGDILGFKFLSRDDFSADSEKKLIELLLKLRAEAREKKDWKSADLIRDELDRIGYELRDGKEGSNWVKKVK